MARMIDAEKYKEDLWVGRDYLDEDTLLTATNILDSQPTIEAEPVRHGRWIEKDDGVMHCTECDRVGNPHTDNYCPNCGAKMDGDSHD